MDDFYVEDRDVTCEECDFDDCVEISLITYGTIEAGEWQCPSCNAMHDYHNDTIWDRADEYIDRMREERAWTP